MSVSKTGLLECRETADSPDFGATEGEADQGVEGQGRKRDCDLNLLSAEFLDAMVDPNDPERSSVLDILAESLGDAIATHARSGCEERALFVVSKGDDGGGGGYQPAGGHATLLLECMRCGLQRTVL